MSTERKLKSIHHKMLLVMVIVVFSFVIRAAFIRLNSNIEYYPTEDSLNYVSYEDYKTFEKVTETLDIKYEFSVVPDKKQLAKSMALKKKQENQIDKIFIQTVIVILAIFIISVMASEIIQYRDRKIN